MRQYDAPVGSGGGGRGMSSDPDDRDPEEIRVEIAQTRTEMSGTIDAIQQRLAPEVLTEQAKDIARDATEQAKSAAQEVLQDAIGEVKEAAKEVTAHAVHEVRDAAHDATVDAKDAAWDATIGRAENAVSNASETARGVRSIVIDTIKQHPIAAALAGLSLFWLYKHRAAGTASGGYRTPGSPQATGTSQAYPIRTGYASQQERDAMASTAGVTGTSPAYGAGAPRYNDESDDGMLSSAAGQVTGAASAAGQMASDAASSAGHMAGEAASTAGQMASGAGETAMDLGSTIVDMIKQNPVPSALVGVGLGWLYMNRSSGQPDYRAHSGSHYLYGPQAAAEVSRSGNQSSGGVGSMVGRATDQVGDLASSAQEHIGDMAGSVQERVGDLAGSTQEHVGDMAGAVMDQTRRTPGQLQRMIQEKPLMAAAVAGSLGAVVGLWLPPTQFESQLMGSARGQVMDRAQEVASETMEKVQDVAQEVRTTVKEEVQAKGLTV